MSLDAARQRSPIIDAVLVVLDTDGYDAVRVTDIASTARVSLATIYKLFGNRDGLILAAVEQWMSEYAYADVEPPLPNETGLASTLRAINTLFAPWTNHPRMLEAFYRAGTGPGGDALAFQGRDAFEAFGERLEIDADPEFLSDVGIIVGHVAHSAITMFVAGSIGVGDIVPILERTLRRLSTGPTSLNLVLDQ